MLTVVLVALGTWLAIAGGLWAVQERLIFLPDPRLLAATGPFALERLETPDGLGLRFLHAPPRAPAAPVILNLHGNGGQAADRVGALAPVVAQGFGVVIAGYRGYGGNPGAPSEAGLRRDVAAHLAWLRARHPGRPVVLWGESLGSALATHLAREDPAGLAALVLDSPFTSVAALAQQHYPWLPVRLLLRHAFESEAALATLRLPVLILHAEGDAVVPAAHGRRLLAVARAAGAPAEALFLPGAAHPAALNGGPAPMAAALRFLARVAPARRDLP